MHRFFVYLIWNVVLWNNDMNKLSSARAMSKTCPDSSCIIMHPIIEQESEICFLQKRDSIYYTNDAFLFMFAKFADITFSLGAEVCSPTRDAICCAPYSPISFYLIRVSWGSRDGCMPSTANCPHIPLIIWEHILTEICLRLKTVGQPLFQPCPWLKALLPRHVNDAETRGKDCPGYCWKQSRHCWFVPWGGRQDLLAKRMKPWSNGQKRYTPEN